MTKKDKAIFPETKEHFRRVGNPEKFLNELCRGGCSDDTCPSDNHVCVMNKKICMSNHNCKVIHSCGGGDEFYCKPGKDSCGFEHTCTDIDNYKY